MMIGWDGKDDDAKKKKKKLGRMKMSNGVKWIDGWMDELIKERRKLNTPE